MPALPTNRAVSRHKIELPTYLDKAYVYTPNVHAQTLLTAEKKAGVLTASTTEEPGCCGNVDKPRRRGGTNRLQ